MRKLAMAGVAATVFCEVSYLDAGRAMPCPG